MAGTCVKICLAAKELIIDFDFIDTLIINS